MFVSAYSHDFDSSPLKGIIILILTDQGESTRNKLLLLVCVCELTPYIKIVLGIQTYRINSGKKKKGNNVTMVTQLL